MRLSTPALASHAVPGVISGFIQYSRKTRPRLRGSLRKVSEDPGENREFPLSAFKRFFIQFTKAFPDIHVEVTDTISEGDASIMVVLKNTS